MRNPILLLVSTSLFISCSSSSTSPVGESSIAVSSSEEQVSSVARSSETEPSSSSATSSAMSSTQPISSSSASLLPYGSLHDDRDGKNYRTIRIGTQTWMAQNLNYGTMVVGSAEQDDDGAAQKYCQEDNESNCDIYGALYQWAEAMALPYSCNSLDCSSQTSTTHQGICPDGWHVPTMSEYQVLKDKIDPGLLQVSGEYLKSDTTGFHMWDSYSNAGNPYGFSALPAGWIDDAGHSFGGLGELAWFWTATPDGNTSAAAPDLDKGSSSFYNNPADRKTGISLRCLKN